MVAALECYILNAPDERITARRDWPDSMTVRTNWGSYGIQHSDWLIAQEDWVEEAVWAVMRIPVEDVMLETYGMLLRRDESVLCVNDLAAMRDLGRRLVDGLNPMAYAELLGEFYSGPKIDGPVVSAPTVSELARSGWFIDDVANAVATHPQLGAIALEPPQLSRAGGRVEFGFDSCHHYLDHFGLGAAIDVLRWKVTVDESREVSWRREYVAKRVTRK
jgi:hypothetical protein